MYLTLLPLAVLAQQENSARILTPVGGEALQGWVAVEGDAFGPEFSAYSLHFSAADDPGSTWFLIARGDTPVETGLLGEWDTQSLTDGAYRLRLQVTLNDGHILEDIIEGLRVRNYTPVETNTPAPTQPSSSGDPPTATATLPPPTVTPLPHNPAQVSPASVRNSILFGILVAPVLLGLLTLYSIRKRRK